MKSRWLSNFNEEYVSANFQHKGKRIHPKKMETKLVESTGKKRKVDVFKKDCEDRNNWRNNDSYAITSSNDMLKGEAKISSGVNNVLSTNNKEVENTLIKIIDLKDKQKRLNKLNEED